MSVPHGLLELSVLEAKLTASPIAVYSILSSEPMIPQVARPELRPQPIRMCGLYLAFASFSCAFVNAAASLLYFISA